MCNFILDCHNLKIKIYNKYAIFRCKIACIRKEKNQRNALIVRLRQCIIFKINLSLLFIYAIIYFISNTFFSIIFCNIKNEYLLCKVCSNTFVIIRLFVKCVITKIFYVNRATFLNVPPSGVYIYTI